MIQKQPIFYLHLFTGTALVIAGIISFFQEGVTTMISWCIFGYMYISMSDIGESSMDKTKKKSIGYTVQLIAGILGAVFSVWLLTVFM